MNRLKKKTGKAPSLHLMSWKNEDRSVLLIRSFLVTWKLSSLLFHFLVDRDILTFHDMGRDFGKGNDDELQASVMQRVFVSGVGPTISCQS